MTPVPAVPAAKPKRSWRTTLTGALTLGLIGVKLATDPINPASIIAHVLEPGNLAAITLAVGQIAGADHAVAIGEGDSGPGAGSLKAIFVGLGIGLFAASALARYL